MRWTPCPTQSPFPSVLTHAGCAHPAHTLPPSIHAPPPHMACGTKIHLTMASPFSLPDTIDQASVLDKGGGLNSRGVGIFSGVVKLMGLSRHLTIDSEPERFISVSVHPSHRDLQAPSSNRIRPRDNCAWNQQMQRKRDYH